VLIEEGERGLEAETGGGGESGTTRSIVGVRSEIHEIRVITG